MPPVGADLVNVQTRARIVPGKLRGQAGGFAPASYDLPDVISRGGNLNGFTNAIRELLESNPGVVWSVSSQTVSYGPFTSVVVEERVDPIAPYGQTDGGPRGDRVYFLDSLGWVFAASVSGYWYRVPGGVDSAGRSGPAFRCGILPSGAPDYSCFPLIDLPQGTLPAPMAPRLGRAPQWTWQPGPEPELEPEGEIVVNGTPAPEERGGLGLPLLLGVAAAVLLNR